LASLEAVKINAIQTSGGSQYFKKARSFGTPDESRCRFQFQVQVFRFEGRKLKT
jgi:hypothetical protein